MTQLLEKAFSQAAELPEKDQDAVASLILEELAAERDWDKAFHASADALSKLADDALAEFDGGRTEPLDVSTL